MRWANARSEQRFAAVIAEGESPDGGDESGGGEIEGRSHGCVEGVDESHGQHGRGSAGDADAKVEDDGVRGDSPGWVKLLGEEGWSGTHNDGEKEGERELRRP